MPTPLLTPGHIAPEAIPFLLAAIVESSDDAIVSKTLEGRITSWNAGARRIFGYTAEEAIGQHITLIIPAERHDEEGDIIGNIRAGNRVDHFETVRRRKDGRLIDISLTVSPVRDQDGRIIGASKIARDISDRRAAERELSHYRDQLEAIVSERTAALEDSARKLRAAERAAALGTLAAGFGHDMSNLLLPIFARLDAMESTGLTPEVLSDLRAIRSAATYLQRLSSGLRLMAMDPAEEGEHASTDLGEWWDDVDGILLGVLPKGVALQSAGMRPAPSLLVAMPRHRLTQVVFNLVQNAGEAMAGRPSGTVLVGAERSRQDGRDAVALTVQDDGPGMTEEVRRRCFEPYFSTKGRTISTGMGLSLVRGMVRSSGGTVSVESTPGKGSTFRIVLPIAEAGSPGPLPAAAGAAALTLSSPSTAAFAAAILEMLGFKAARVDRPAAGDTLWVTDRLGGETAACFLSDPAHRLILVGGNEQVVGSLREHAGRVGFAKEGSSASLRGAIAAVAGALRSAEPAGSVG